MESQIEDHILIDMYKTLLFIRRVEEKIAELYPQQEMRCPVHLCIGHEAIAVGVCKNLNQEDIVFSNHRSHGHYLAKGGDLNRMIAEIYGKSTGCSKGMGGSMHLIDLSVNFFASTSIVGGTIPLAAGTAFASKFKNSSNISVAFFGDSALEEGVFHETLNFSSLKKLPVLFVCENNLYASQTPITERQPKREIYKFVEGYGVKSYKADGNDVIEVYKAAKKAIEDIRLGNGPAFIEFSTYRWKEHCGPYEDDELGYRPKEEIMKWKSRCPCIKLNRQLLSTNTLEKQKIDKIEKEIQNRINESILFAEKSQFPEKGTINKYYSD